MKKKSALYPGHVQSKGGASKNNIKITIYKTAHLTSRSFQGEITDWRIIQKNFHQKNQFPLLREVSFGSGLSFKLKFIKNCTFSSLSIRLGRQFVRQ
ncbi:MAG: hypothetical protein V1706_10915 [Pseudomonadota bacterium]